MFCFRTMLSLLTMPISQKDNSPGCHIYHKSHATIHHKDVQVQKHMKTFNQIHPTTIYITGGELFRFSSGLRPLLTILHYSMFWPPGSSNAQNMAKWILSMWMLMFKHRVSMRAGPPFSIYDRYEHDLELLPEHLDFQTCGKQPFLVPTSSFCSIGHNDRERWFSNPGIWKE